MKKNSSVVHKLASALFLSAGIVAPSFAATCQNQVLNADGSLTPSTCVMFVTQDMYNGGGLEGYTGANNKCQSQAAKLFPSLTNKGITFKALLNWNHATELYRDYYRPYDAYNNKQVYIGRASGPNFARVLVNPIAEPINPDILQVWTGLMDGMSMNSDSNTCANWHENTYKGSGGNRQDYHGYAGYAGAATGWDNDNKSQCDKKKALICVAQ